VLCEDRFAKTDVLYAHFTYKRTLRSWYTTVNYVERFLNGPVHEFYSLKASQMCRVHTSSHEITNEPCVTVSSKYEHTAKTVTADLHVTTNYDAETNTLLAEKKSRMLATTLVGDYAASRHTRL